ncbi:MAG TPA: YIP1 family protein [Gemmatimonadaceae bacterium]|nr:YIP1 family protein [Gemmatimonadaceae bacterium]
MPTAPMREPLVRPAAAGPAGLTSRQAVWQRMLRALRFDASVYTELERDPTGTRQAARVVAVVAAAAALGTVLLEGWRPGAILGAVVAALLHWLLWGGLESLLGRALFRRQTPLAHHLRALGYAQTPQLLALLAFVPTVGAWAVLGSRLLTMLAGN